MKQEQAHTTADKQAITIYLFIYYHFLVMFYHFPFSGSSFAVNPSANQCEYMY